MSNINVAKSCSIDPVHIPLHDQCCGHGIQVEVNGINNDKWTINDLPSADAIIHIVQSPNDEKSNLQICDKIDALVDKFFSEAVSTHQFKGKEGKHHIGRLGPGKHYANAALVGAGKPPSSSAVDCESQNFVFGDATDTKGSPVMVAGRLAKTVAAVVKEIKATSAVVAMKDMPMSKAAVETFITNFLICMTPDERFKSKKSPDGRKLTKLVILLSDCCSDGVKNANPDAARRMAEGVDLARQLVTTPPNYCNPDTMALLAENLAKAEGLTSKILGREDLEKLNMGAFLAVGKGSIFGPRLIHLTYTDDTTKPEDRYKICLVGKGITMDTGGYNLKVAGSSIELMKFDMGGGAAVLGSALTIARAKPKGVEVHFIVAAAENMISSLAYRPGDIITASDGTTITVGNTDAEGRLVLCDCLVYAKKLQMNIIMDMATLTGACMIALGASIGGLYGSSTEDVKLMLQGARSSGETLWPMPLHQPYAADLENKVSDITNISCTRYGGSITAALFLQHFVKDQAWCHIDIAGPAWDFKDHQGTGFGVRSFVNYVLQRAKQ